jgi:catechol 2,3-dioxygenase-like lactoylglutathione lyase family enzyme
MDNVGIVVDDLGATIDFFRELGLELEGQATIEGEWAGRVTGLADQRVEIAMMRRQTATAVSSSPASSRHLSSRITAKPR